MKKQNHKSFPARTATLLFAALLAHLSTWGQNSVTTITTSENITKESTVYAGEVVVDGVTMTKYLFSDNMSRKEDVITNLLSGLQGMTDGSYATLLEGTEADVEATGLALCSDPELIAAMDKNWSSAQYVGTLYFSGKTVLSETNSNLYDIDEGFKAALDVQTAARAENIENLADVKKCIVTHLDSRTVTDVWYNIIDGSTVRHSDINVIYDSEATTVIYTRVELETLQETKKEFVDLGLPSGTLWATCNVGASNPHDTGLFFAWGDTEGHGSDVSDGYLFSWENYKWGEVDGEDTWLTKYCTDSSRGKDGFTDGKDELDPEDDAAYVNWGSQWRMPSKQQLDELKEQCTWTQTTLQEVNGYEVTGPNGNTIFLPTTSWRIDDMLLDGGAYWSRTTNPEDDGGAYYLGWDDWGWYEYGGRLDGQCVRPVMNRFTVTIPASGIATFSADCSVIVPEGLTAHYCTTYDSEVGTIGVKAISGVIPAETGVLLCGERGQSYTLTATDDAAEAISGNALVAVTASTHVAATDGVFTNFMLKSGEFIKIADNTSVMPANKAYLQIATADLGSNARRIALNWAGEATAISGMVDSRPSDSECFDMQGRKVTGRPAHGVYIINGKKSVIR